MSGRVPSRGCKKPLSLPIMLISNRQHPLPSGSGPFLRRDFLLIFAAIDNLISIYNFPFLISVQGLEILIITIT